MQALWSYPIPVLISIAVSSNLQGAATLVGDTTSVMLAGELGMSFMDFFFMDGRLSIFWAVELGMMFTIPVLFFFPFVRKNFQSGIMIGSLKGYEFLFESSNFSGIGERSTQWLEEISSTLLHILFLKKGTKLSLSSLLLLI